MGQTQSRSARQAGPEASLADGRPTGAAERAPGQEATFWQPDCALRRDVELAACSNDGELADDARATCEAECERLARKLSIVSNRNVQLLAIASGGPASGVCAGGGGAPEKLALEQQQQQQQLQKHRRRSSLINMILGSARAGPRFSEDLCSLDSRLSELGGFGIEFFADPAIMTGLSTPTGNHNMRGRGNTRPSNSVRLLIARRQFVADQSATHTDGRRAVSSGRELSLDWSRNPSLATTSSACATGCETDPNLALASRVNQLPPPPHEDCAKTESRAQPTPLHGVHYDNQLPRQQSESRCMVAPEPRSRPIDHQYLSNCSEATVNSADAIRRPSSLSLASLDLGRLFERPAAGAPCASCAVSCGKACTGLPTTSIGAERDQSAPAGSCTFKSCRCALGALIRPDSPRRSFRRTSSELSLYGCFGFGCARGSSCASCFQPIADLTKGANVDERPRASSQDRAGSISSERSSKSVQRRKSAASAGSQTAQELTNTSKQHKQQQQQQRQQQHYAQTELGLVNQTKLIIMFQVCLPFMLAGFGNMAAGLTLGSMAQWQALREIPCLLVLLPSFVGLKGNIEMTLASRLSTLSNLNLLSSSEQRRRAFLSNLMLMLWHAIGLSAFATFAALVADSLIGHDFVAVHAALAVPPTPAQQLQLRHGGRWTHANAPTNSHNSSSTAASSSGKTSQIDAMQANSAALTALLIVLPCSLITAVILVFLSSLIVAFTVWLANKIQVNPDNLSTLVAALYGDVSCMLAYGLFASLMHHLYRSGQLAPAWLIIAFSLLIFLLLAWAVLRNSETKQLAFGALPPSVTSILVSLGSGAMLSLVLSRYNRIALYQPVVNGFGANLIAAQASRISTWLWCRTLRRLSLGSSKSSHTLRSESSLGTGQKFGTLDSIRSAEKHLSSEIGPTKFDRGVVTAEQDELYQSQEHKSSNKLSSIFCYQSWHLSNNSRKAPESLAKRLAKYLEYQFKKTVNILISLSRLFLWSFVNSTPNSTAAKLLLITIMPAHTLYFLVIWLLSPANHITLTWPFYLVYIVLCLNQVFILLLICEPLMRVLMKYQMDPDVFGISLLMSLADLIGTICLTGGFQFLASIGDPNAAS